MITTSYDIGKDLCTILGVESKNVKSVNINITAGEVVIVTIEQYLVEDQKEKLLSLLTNYNIVKKDDNSTTEK